MAKAKYNPLNVFREDPLAALKRATEEAPANEAELRRAAGTPIPTDPQVQGQKPDVVTEKDWGAFPEPSTSLASTKPLSASLNTSRNTVYLYPEDLTKLRQLSGYVSTEHGIRANDSMIFRAALALLEPDVRLLHALRETEMLDRRRKARV